MAVSVVREEREREKERKREQNWRVAERLVTLVGLSGVIK